MNPQSFLDDLAENDRHPHMDPDEPNKWHGFTVGEFRQADYTDFITSPRGLLLLIPEEKNWNSPFSTSERATYIGGAIKRLTTVAFSSAEITADDELRGRAFIKTHIFHPNGLNEEGMVRRERLCMFFRDIDHFPSVDAYQNYNADGSPGVGNTKSRIMSGLYCNAKGSLIRV